MTILLPRYSEEGEIFPHDILTNPNNFLLPCKFTTPLKNYVFCIYVKVQNYYYLSNFSMVMKVRESLCPYHKYSFLELDKFTFIFSSQ